MAFLMRFYPPTRGPFFCSESSPRHRRRASLATIGRSFSPLTGASPAPLSSDGFSRRSTTFFLS